MIILLLVRIFFNDFFHSASVIHRG